MTISLESVTVVAIFHFLLVFCRMGSMIMLLPGVGEIFVSARVRLLFALAVSYVLFPVISPQFPDQLPLSGIAIVLMLLGEVLIGAFIGALARLLQSIMHTAGMIMAFLSGLAAAQLFDATQGSQGSVFGNFLTLTAITLFFVTNLHHLMLSGMADSYALFSVGSFLPAEDFAFMAAKLLSKAFMIAFKIAAPQVVIGLCMYFAAGVMGRLMPAMQVFFILIPMQILVSFNVLMITLAAGMMIYLNHFEDSMNQIFYP